MALPCSDDFARADGPLGSNWTTLDGTWAIASGAAKATTFTAGNVASWTADTFNDAQYAQCVPTGAACDGGPCVRLASLRGYLVAATAGAATVTLYRLNSDESYTSLQTLRSSGYSPPTTIYLQANGSTLVAKESGSQIGTDQTDGTYASGAAGIFTYDSSATKLIDDFAAGNLSTNHTPAPSLRSVTITGQSATPSVTGGAAIEPVSAGAVNVTGQSALASIAQRVSVTAGALTTTGQSATASLAQIVSVSAGSLAWSGLQAPIVLTAVMSPPTCALALAGQSASGTAASVETWGYVVVAG